MTRGEWLAMPTIVENLPLAFPRGGRWDVVAIHCNDCERRVPDAETRGHVTPVITGYRSALSGFDVEMWGICPDCNVSTHAHMVLHDDMTMTRHLADGTTRRIGSRRPSWWERLASWLARSLGRG